MKTWHGVPHMLNSRDRIKDRRADSWDNGLCLCATNRLYFPNSSCAPAGPAQFWASAIFLINIYCYMTASRSLTRPSNTPSMPADTSESRLLPGVEAAVRAGKRCAQVSHAWEAVVISQETPCHWQGSWWPGVPTCQLRPLAESLLHFWVFSHGWWGSNCTRDANTTSRPRAPPPPPPQLLGPGPSKAART